MSEYHRFRAERDLARRDSPMGRYQARPTNNVMPVGMNYLSDLVIRPGIRRRLEPLCLYRGNFSPGRAHRYWNFTLLMMAAEAATLADGIKLANNAAFAQLCGPSKPPTKITLWSFFGRLWDNPDITDNICGLTDYVRSMGLGPSRLRQVSHETAAQFCAPWRISTHPDYDPNAERPESGIRPIYYPFLVHNPKNIDEGKALVLLANHLVPAHLPDMIRADICQDLIEGILSGDVDVDRADYFVVEYLRRVYRMFPSIQPPKHGTAHQSIDKPLFAYGVDPINWTDRN